jgi:WbqC-like protein family
MIVSIHQPAYLPWLGYFDRVVGSDVHVVLDNVQFEKNSFINRNKVRTHQGWCWLTVPIKTAGRFGKLSISDLEIADEKPWAAKHWNTVRLSYSKAPFFQEHARFFEDSYSRRWTRLADLLEATTDYLFNAFGIATKRYLASQLKVGGKKDELVVNICRELGATVYLSGPLGRNYLREELFQEHGIAVQYHDYRHPKYPQIYPDFQPYMSALDLLFNVGPRSLEIMRTQHELVSQ